MSNYLSFRQYAKHRGVSPEAVSKAVETGRIQTVAVNGKRLIDPVAADQSWEANTSSRKPNAESPDSVTYAKARAHREAYEAKIAKLKYEEMSKLLCRVEDVKKDAFEAGRNTQSALMAMSDRLGPVLAAETDPGVIRRLLEEEIVKCLRAITGNDD